MEPGATGAGGGLSVGRLLSAAAAVLGKDLLAEYRSRQTLTAVLLFSLAALLAVALTAGGARLTQTIANLPPGIAAQAAAFEALLDAALLWVVLLFGAVAGLSRAFVQEAERGTARTLRLVAPPAAVWLGKFGYNVLLLASVQIVVTPLLLAAFARGADGALLVVFLMLGNLGLSATCTTLAAIVAQTGSRGTLFGALALPLLLTLLVPLVDGTRHALLDPAGGGWAAARPTLQVAAAFAVAAVAAGLLLFEVIWEE